MRLPRQWIAPKASALVAVALIGLLPQAPTATAPRIGYFEHDGARIRYWEMGSGDALVLIHGLLGNADVWRELAPLDELARQWRVVAIDLRGNGESTRYRDPARYGRALAGDVVGLLDHLGIDRAHVLGYSYGGLVVGALLADHPERLASAILGGASRIRPGDADDVSWAVTLADELEGGNAAEWLADALATGDADQDGAQRELIERRVREADLGASAALLRATEDLAVSDISLRDNAVPLLAIVGELDPNHAEVVEMAALTRRMTVATIAGADHAAAPRTAEFWARVTDWLRQQAP